MATVRTRGDGVKMGLSAPNLLTFLISFVIVLAVVFAKYFGAVIPGLSGEAAAFVGLLIAYLILWIVVPKGMFASGKLLPGRISAFGPANTTSPTRNPNGEMM